MRFLEGEGAREHWLPIYQEAPSRHQTLFSAGIYPVSELQAALEDELAVPFKFGQCSSAVRRKSVKSAACLAVCIGAAVVRACL